MQIPRAWIKSSGTGRKPDGSQIPVATWGWGDDEGAARRSAADRLQRLMGRISRGEPFPRKYTYDSRPLREEILEVIDSDGSGRPEAIVTRNSYGAQVLNTARLLFLDIDLQPASLLQRLRRFFGSGQDNSEEAVLARLRVALTSYGRATFRIYRTASGFRVMAIDREFDPAGRDTQELMKATGTDPAFARLCTAQSCFRARLTPKPWRCGGPVPPSRHPRSDDETAMFASWLAGYEKASAAYSTCRYIESIGNGRPRGSAGTMVELHDRFTRCNEPLPLA